MDNSSSHLSEYFLPNIELRAPSNWKKLSHSNKPKVLQASKSTRIDFTISRQVEHITKKFDSCPSKLDSKMLSLQLGI